MALDTTIKQLLEQYNAVAQAQTTDTLRGLADCADDLFNAAREEIQAQTGAQISVVMEKLDTTVPLLSSDIDLIKLWMVGDAVAYLRRENDYQNWLKELSRLAGELARLNHPNLTVQEMGDMQGTVSDLCGLIPLVQKYAEQQERLARFDKAVLKLDAQSRAFIKTVLQHKIDSPDD